MSLAPYRSFPRDSTSFRAQLKKKCTDNNMKTAADGKLHKTNSQEECQGWRPAGGQVLAQRDGAQRHCPAIVALVPMKGRSGE
ncbi:hypothetical protein AALO_G00260070 [Alosa alosa]|uniref:Uncharacterized protein n=1 Tax=Alosa alosa TaxID=278164 RepID=A0AAV6FTC3_9TELE|nr:hypothetical protein AALO_G00260070 [Alosa alosa]